MHICDGGPEDPANVGNDLQQLQSTELCECVYENSYAIEGIVRQAQV